MPPSNSQTLLCVPARKTVAQASRLFFQNQKTTGKLIYAALDVILEPVASVYDRRTKPSRGTRPPHRAKRKETSKGRRPTLHAHIDLIAGLSFLYSVAVSAPHKQATIPDRGSKAKNILWHLRPINPPSSASAFLGVLCALAVKNSSIAIFGTLDEKIELNRRMNATLEAMARALFQSWFVDFDPVRRNAEGATPRPEDSLFPDSFEDSAIGEIPQGWTVEPVGNVVDCVGGGTPSTKETKFWEDGIHHWTTPKDFSSLQSPILIDTSRKLTDAGIAKISSGLLPAGTLLLSSRAPVGYLAISATPVAINQGFIAMKCNDHASNYFMLNWCQSNMEEIKSRATGTTFPEISKNSFRPISVVLPPKNVVAEFNKQVAPLYAKITANLRQSRNLATLHDTLFPELLSGEVINLIK